LSKIANVATSDFNQASSDKKEPGRDKRESEDIPFRQEFPFLDSAGCPMELKILVTDKFSSFYRYRNLHQKLVDCTNVKECADISAEIIKSYLDNRSIYAELDYFKKHHVILGKHPIFMHFNKMKSIRNLSIKDLVKRQILLEHNIWRIESELKKKDKPHLKVERQERLQQKKAELAEVKRLIE
jgi:hypothetical protein